MNDEPCKQRYRLVAIIAGIHMLNTNENPQDKEDTAHDKRYAAIIWHMNFFIFTFE